MNPRPILLAAVAFASFACASDKGAQRPVGWTPFNELAASNGARTRGQSAPLTQPEAAPSGPMQLLAPLREPEPAADDEEAQFVEEGSQSTGLGDAELPTKIDPHSGAVASAGDLALDEDPTDNAEDTLADDEEDLEADEEDLEDDEPVPGKAPARRRVVRE